MVVVAGHRASGEQFDIGVGTQFGHRLLDPGGSGLAPEVACLREQTAAELRLLVGDQYPRPGTGRLQGGGQTSGSSAHDEDLAVLVHPVVGIRIRAVRHATEARHVAQEAFRSHPQPRRSHEGLVVEARRQEPTESASGTLEKRCDGGSRFESIVQLDLRRAQIRDARGPVAQLHDGVGFLGTVAHDAPGPGVFETSGHDVHAVGEQGGSQGVARAALEPLAIEREGQGPSALYPAPRGQAKSLRGH